MKRPRLGLRARVTLTFALGALLLSASMSVLTFGLTRENLLNQREEAAVALAVDNAGKMADSLEPSAASEVSDCDAEQIVDDLTSLVTPGGAQLILSCNDRWYS